MEEQQVLSTNESSYHPIKIFLFFWVFLSEKGSLYIAPASMEI